MMRALLTAGLVTAVAIHLGAPTETALGYSLITALTLWYLWPLLRRLPRTIRRTRLALARHRRPTTRQQQAQARRPAGLIHRLTAPRIPPRNHTAAPAPRPELTQINHHHHYYGPTARPEPHPTALALPFKAQQQLAHDAIYTTIDGDYE